MTFQEFVNQSDVCNKTKHCQIRFFKLVILDQKLSDNLERLELVVGSGKQGML